MRGTATTALFLALTTLCACGAGVRSTPDMVRSECLSRTRPDCFSFCNQYRDLLDGAKFASKRDCREACTGLFQRQLSGPDGAACERGSGAGEDLCKLYCNQNFD